MSKAEVFRPRRLALAIAVAIGAGPAAGWAAAGRVQFAFGEVSVQDAGGSSSALRKGQDVEAGDTIVTERGRVQIKFTDGSLVSLQPQSTFKIDDYNFAGDDDGSERSFFSLFRGGLRTITGVIGRRNRDSYRVSTPVATIGIRGTEYLIKLDGTGAVVTVGDGAILVINEGGQVVLVNGQTGVIVDGNTAARITDEKPVLPPPPPKDLRDDPGTDDAHQDDDDFIAAVVGDNGDPDETKDRLGDPTEEPDEPDEPEEPEEPEEPQQPEEPEEPEEPPPPPPPPTKLESGPGFTVAYSFYSAGIESPEILTETDADTSFTGGQLTGWSSNVEGVVSSDKGDLELVEAGSDRFIGWGRWSNPNADGVAAFQVQGRNESFASQSESLHYVVGEPTDIALAAMGRATARYSVLSYTTPTERDGTEGVFNGATFLLDFSDAFVTGTADVSMGPNDYDLEFGTAVTGGRFATSAFVDSPNGACSFACDGAVGGLIAGPAAERAGFVYHIRNSSFGEDIFGAVTFTADPNGPLPDIGQ